MRLLHLLPRVPPAICGVADYAWNLALALRSREAVESTFLAAGSAWVEPGSQTTFPVHRLAHASAGSLHNWLTRHQDRHNAVLLHLSPYGFDKRAVPWWLAGAISRQARSPHAPPCITFFHELYADGPPTTSAFWLKPLQKAVLLRIGRASAGLLTNRRPYADWLEARLGKPIKVLNVFSNFGEPEQVAPLRDREPALAMFTSASHNGKPLEANIETAAGLARRLEFQRVHVIGGCNACPATAAGLPVIRHGVLPASEISALLAQCRAAFSTYNPLYFGKSTLIASFAAHGLAVIAEQHDPPDLPDGLSFGREIIAADRLPGLGPDCNDSLQMYGDALRAWYLNHNLPRTASAFAEEMRKLCDVRGH